MRKILPLAALFSGVSLLLLGTGLLTTLLAVRGGLEGFGSQVLGMIGAMYFIGFLAGTYIGPAMIRRVGHVRSFAFFTVSICCAILLHELFSSAVIWGVLRLVVGVSMFGLYNTIESWINSYAVPEQRSHIYLSYTMVNLGSLALSQQLLHWGHPEAHALFSIAAILVCAAVLPVSATRLTQPTIQEIRAIGLREMYQRAPLACAGGLFSGLAQGAFWGLAAVWADQNQLGKQGIAWFMTCAILGGAFFQWPIGQLTNRLDRGHVISVIALISASMASLLWVADRFGEHAILTAIFLYGGFAFALYPLAVARMMDRVEKSEIVGGSAAVLLIHGIGACLGPIIAGSLMENYGHSALPLWFVATDISLAICAWWISSARPADIEHQTILAPMIRTSPAVFQGLEKSG